MPKTKALLNRNVCHGFEKKMPVKKCNYRKHTEGQ
jgi:hypothetical protein